MRFAGRMGRDGGGLIPQKLIFMGSAEKGDWHWSRFRKRGENRTESHGRYRSLKKNLQLAGKEIGQEVVKDVSPDG